MSDDNTNDDTGGIANLRKQFDELTKTNAANTERLAKYEQAERAKTVGEVLKAKGLTEAHAKFYTSEDVSEDAVGKWATDNAALFGATTQSGEQDANAAAAALAASITGQAPVQPITGGMPIGNPLEQLHLMQTLPVEKLVELKMLPESALRK